MLTNTIFYAIGNGDQKMKFYVKQVFEYYSLILSCFSFFTFNLPHIKFLSFTIEYTLQFYIKCSDLNRDLDAESNK